MEPIASRVEPRSIAQRAPAPFDLGPLGRLTMLHSESARRRAKHAGGLPYDEAEFAEIMALVTEASRVEKGLCESLRQSPKAWERVLPELLVLEDLECARRTVEALSETLDTTAERRATELLATESSPQARVLLAKILGCSDGAQSLSSLAVAAEGASEAAVRMEAAVSLGRRADRNATDREWILQILRRRSGSDPDAGVRECARRTLDRIGWEAPVSWDP